MHTEKPSRLTNPLWALQVAQLLASFGRHDAAYEYYDRVRASPVQNTPVLWARMADCQRALGNPEGPISLYKSVLSGVLGPPYNAAYCFRVVLPLMGHPSRAESGVPLVRLLFGRGNAVWGGAGLETGDAGYVEAALTLADLYCEAGQVDDAATLLASVEDLTQEVPRPTAWLTRTLTMHASVALPALHHCSWGCI